MFNPTKSHEKYIKNNQPKIRMGSRVPKDAVNLAYSHTPPLKVSQNVQVTDLSRYILENINEDRIQDARLYPNDKNQLSTWETGDTTVHSQTLIVTNIFDGDTPLYYSYELKYPLMNKFTVDSYGFFTTNTIKFITEKGETLPEEYRYKLEAIPTDNPKLVRVKVYTNFETQPSIPIKVVYTAIDEGKIVPNRIEVMNPQPVFTKSNDLEKVVTKPRGNQLYYQSQGKNLGDHHIYVSEVPIRERDYRTPVPFKYRINAEATVSGVTFHASTPWIYDSILDEDSVTYLDEEYEGKYKKVDGRTAIDILSDYEDTEIYRHPESIVKVTVESSVDTVSIQTQVNGMNYIYASTSEKVDHVVLPPHHKTQYRDQEIEFRLLTKINDYEPELSKHVITPSQGIVKVFSFTEDESGTATVFESEGEITPVTIITKEDGVYAFTDEWDKYYVAEYAVQLQDNKQIRLLPPAPSFEEEVTENWYARIKYGQFSQDSTTNTGIPTFHRFTIPEYYKQDFDEEYGLPYMKVMQETPVVIGKHKLQLRYAPLAIRYDKNAGQHNLEVFVNGVEASLKSWDAIEGTIEVDTSLRNTDRITVNYYYEENTFTYRGYWDETNQRFWSLDLNPSSGHFYTDMNPDTGEIVEVPSFQLINKTVYIYMKPNARFSENQELIRGSYQEKVLFHTFEPLEDTRALLLGRIQVRPNSSVNNIKLIDTRVRGGGVKESIRKELMLEIEPESKFYWDVGYWDGEPYNENSVFVARVPKYVLKEQRGVFTKDQVEAIVKKHVGYGTLVVIEYVEEPKHLLSSPLTLSSELNEG